LLNSTIKENSNIKKENELYIVKRETLKVKLMNKNIKLILQILEDSESFSYFKEFYLDSLENLKIIMSLLNHNCLRIRIKALCVLYYFFSDIDSRNGKITNVLLMNKQNFEKYFDKFLNDPDVDSEMLEKANFILYQLERLQNNI